MALAIGAIYYFTRGTGSDTHQFVEVKRMDLAEEVLVTGRIKAASSVSLGFEKTGKVETVGAGVGEYVYSDQVLASLDQGQLPADLKGAEAKVASEQSKLDQLKRGTRPEELSVAEAQYASSLTAIDNAKRNIIDKISDAYIRADDAVTNQVDQMLSNPKSSTPQLNFQSDNQQAAADVLNSRIDAEKSLASMALEVRYLSQTTDLASSLEITKTNLENISTLLNRVAVLVNSLSQNQSLTLATVSDWKGDIAGARTSVQLAMSNLTAADEKYRNAMDSATVQKRQLTLSRAGSTAEDIASQESVVKQARAQLAGINIDINRTYLRSPIYGLVTKQDAKVGEVAGANQPLVTVLDIGNLEVEANVPEVDIGRVGINNKVGITLDAFSGEIFVGSVSYIDPAETIVDGVVNFKIAVKFKVKDKRFKSGLTANLRIKTIEKEAVLTLPQFAIIENDAGTFVNRSVGKILVQTPIQTGIRGVDGYVEVVGGLSEGDLVQNIGIKTSK